MYYIPKGALPQYISSLRSVVTDFRSFLTTVFDYEGGFPQTPSEACLPFRCAAFQSSLQTFSIVNLHGFKRLSTLGFILGFRKCLSALSFSPCGDGRYRSLFLIVSPSIPQNTYRRNFPILQTFFVTAVEQSRNALFSMLPEVVRSL